MEIKNKLKELGFERGRVFSTKKVEGYVFVTNQTNEIFFVSDEYREIMKTLSKEFKITSDDKRHLPDVLAMFIDSARNKEEKELFKDLVYKINILAKHKNIAS